MTDDREFLVHLAGYSTIAAVLATANWAGLGATVLAVPLILATLGFAGYLGAAWVVRRAREKVPDAEGSTAEGSERPKAAATDGGEPSQ